MVTDSTVPAASSGLGRGDLARWQHREQLRRTRQVVQLVQAGKRGNSTADGLEKTNKKSHSNRCHQHRP